MRRRAGQVLLLSGLACVLWAGIGWTRGAVSEDRARAAWAAAVARAAVERSHAALDRESAPGAAPGAPIARLIVPRAGIDEVVVEGVTDAVLMAGPGRVPAGAFPGDPGNAVISAHRDRHFRTLGRVAPGDTIIVETLHRTTRWVVERRMVVDADYRVELEGAEPVLTLSTCWPIGFLGAAPDRLVLTAKLIG